MLYNIGGHDQKHLGFVTHLILNLFMVVAVRTYLLLQKKSFHDPHIQLHKPRIKSDPTV